MSQKLPAEQPSWLGGVIDQVKSTVQAENKKVIKELGANIQKIDENQEAMKQNLHAIDKRLQVVEGGANVRSSSTNPTAQSCRVSSNTVVEPPPFIPGKVEINNFCEFGSISTEGIVRAEAQTILAQMIKASRTSCSHTS